MVRIRIIRPARPAAGRGLGMGPMDWGAYVPAEEAEITAMTAAVQEGEGLKWDK